ncbi:conserved hypothetical protein [Shewanella sediminis HAW-EB3]|uniref:Phosphate-selective porin O and P n=1 Tax=Shewanella sediminis (strain HAW-EB3) TaxID=425104 RepID=A8G0F7_SHESH|nr:hypothetical protein [Shewanella sediminis]ABV38580.1 conserved hypothetical protein [Shewanella sediminis HAW-EB3]
MFTTVNRYSLPLCSLLLLTSSVVTASEWQLSGFIGQGFVAGEDTQFIVGEDSSTFDITEAAFAVSWKPIEHVRFASALTFRQWGTLSEADVMFDYLFAEYSHQVGEGMLGIRAGRFKNETGFYSSTRDVPFTRPSIMLPQSIYSDYFRDAQLHIEGGDLFGMHQVLDGVVDWHISVGQVNVTEDLDRNVMGSTDFGEFSAEDYYSGDIEFQNDYLRLGVSYYDAEISFDPFIPGYYYPGDIRLKNWVFSGQFRYERLELTAEYLKGDRVTNGLVAPIEADDLYDPSVGYYIDLRAYLPNEVELFVRYDKHIDNTDDPDGTNYEAVYGSPAYFGYTKDWTFGARWFPSNDWLLAVEYHDVEGASWVTPIVSPDPLTQAKHWSLFALQLSYRFQW